MSDGVNYSTLKSTLGLTDDQLRLLSIFHSFALKKISYALDHNLRYVHYTTADTGIKIIRSKEVWMRKASSMNDFSEIQHGLNCLSFAYDNNKEEFELIFDSMFPNFSKRLEDNFNQWIPEFKYNTYVACVSEHNVVGSKSEDELGRLSMWRAYGGKAGVAMVMNGSAFHIPTDALKAYTNPVAYFTREEFEAEYVSILAAVKSNCDWLKSFGEEYVFQQIFGCFRTAVLCTKHPGFYEEREWRVIYSPSLEKSNKLKEDVQTIEGTPQPIVKIPLRNIPEEKLVGIEIPELIDRVIVGPTDFPLEIRDAFVTELLAAGMADAEERVTISFIPLRQGAL